MRRSDEWCCMNCVNRGDCSTSDNPLNLLNYCANYSDEDDVSDSYSAEDLEDW